MQRKKIPDSPRFDFVTKKAYEFLLECGYTKFPISPYEVLKELDDVVCLPWSEARKIFKSDDPFHLRQQGAEGRTIHRRDDGKYYIIYDDANNNSPDRISWTIMHEIGHVILGHLVDFDKTNLNRGGITNKENGVLEVEAHYFAAEFLMPTAIIKYLSSITVDEIALLFGVSGEAAQKKYKRVFNTSYLPYTENENKVIRNFYKFLITEADDAIYKGIYGDWGIPWLGRYTSVLRKCPSCLSYINDPSAVYCPNCGERIEQHKLYRTMYERLQAQQDFNKQSGISHLNIPFVEEKKTSSGIKFEKLTACPTCLNHVFSEDAKFCPICGQPITNKDSDDSEDGTITDCFSTVSGRKMNSSLWYPSFERRYKQLLNYKGKLLKSDWVEYSYWEFTKWTMRGKNSGVSMDLQSALLYTNAFIDDNDDIHIVTDTEQACKIINENQNELIRYLLSTDNIDRERIEALVAYDL